MVVQKDILWLGRVAENGGVLTKAPVRLRWDRTLDAYWAKDGPDEHAGLDFRGPGKTKRQRTINFVSADKEEVADWLDRVRAAAVLLREAIGPVG